MKKNTGFVSLLDRLNRSKYFFIAMVILTNFVFSATKPEINLYEADESLKFQGIKQIEVQVLGYDLENSGLSFEDRLNMLEKRVFGNVSSDNVLVRQRKLYDLLFLDSSYFSLITKTDNLEDYLFQNRKKEKDIMTRVERVEEYLFGTRLEKDSLVSRIDNLYEYLLLRDQNFAIKAKFLQKEIDIFEIKAIKRYGSLQLNQVLEFNLEKDIPGLAKAGSLVIGQVISKKKSSMKNDEEVVIIFRKIINTDGRDISIYKTLELKGNSSGLFFGKQVRIDNVLIIG